jgi:flagellar FliL protein
MKAGKKILLLGGVVVGLGVAAGLAYVFVLSGPSVPPEIPDPAEGQYGVMLALEERVVNLVDGGDYRYVKVGVTIEIRPDTAAFYTAKGEARKVLEEEALKEYEVAVPLFLDAVGRVVGAKSSDDLATPQGRESLKTELHEAVARVIGEREVLDVYFTDLVMQ